VSEAVSEHSQGTDPDPRPAEPDPRPAEPDPRPAEAGSPAAAVADLEALATGELVTCGLLAGASNHTLLMQVGDAEAERFAVYKPRSGERPLWDFPRGTLCDREVAAYVVSEALGWELVPPTVLREDAPRGSGAVQQFVPHDPDRHYFALIDEGGYERRLAQMAVFDLLLNNADRKASHVVLVGEGRIIGVDHGLAFHVEPKLRTVIWDLAGHEVERGWREDLRRLADNLSGDGPVRGRLAPLLAEEELEALVARAGALTELTALPELPPGRRPYPWPPL
jgi:uncharacterized repeat protein (TIGR03843 family)